MKQDLTGFEYYKAVIAKWIVINICYRISPLGIAALCLELADLYKQNVDTIIEEIKVKDPDEQL